MLKHKLAYALLSQHQTDEYVRFTETSFITVLIALSGLLLSRCVKLCLPISDAVSIAEFAQMWYVRLAKFNLEYVLCFGSRFGPWTKSQFGTRPIW